MKTLESFEFARSAARSTYDWDAILNGEINVLEVGKDFTCKASTVKTRTRAVAKKMGLKVRISSDREGNVVVKAEKVVKAAPVATATETTAAAPAGRRRR